ncbi:MAG: hypothetical protein WC614_13260 [bacterium]
MSFISEREEKMARWRYEVLDWQEETRASVDVTCKEYGITKRQLFRWKRKRKSYRKFLWSQPHPDRILELLTRTLWFRHIEDTKEVQKIIRKNWAGGTHWKQSKPLAEEFISITDGVKKKTYRSMFPEWWEQLEFHKSPKHKARKITEELEAQIVKYRETNPKLGCNKIAQHFIGLGFKIGHTGVYRVLNEHRLVKKRKPIGKNS